MNTAIFRTLSPIKQLFALFAFSFISMILFYFVGAELCRLVWGIEIAQVLTASQPASEEAVYALRLIMAFQHVGYFILPALLFTQLAADNRNDYLLVTRMPTFKLIGLTAIVTTASFYVINLLVGINQLVEIPEEFGEMLQKMHVENTATQELLMQGEGTLNYLASLLILAFIPAIGEELMFRGVIMKLFTRITNNIHLGIWLTAIVFALLHLQILHFLPIVFMGALFGYLLIWTGNIWIPILAHLLNNAVTVTLSYLIEAEQLPADVENTGMSLNDWLSTGIAIISLITVLFFIAKNSRWEEIKQAYFQTPESIN